MTKPIPPIMKYMSTVPFSIEKDSPLLEAAELMQKNHIRHLPVLYQGKIEGILLEFKMLCQNNQVSIYDEFCNQGS